MIIKHDHIRPLIFLYIQHQARLRVLNVECRLHKQDRLYSMEQNVAVYAVILKTQTTPLPSVHWPTVFICYYTRVGSLIVATIYLHLLQNRYTFRSFTVLQCNHQHCVQPVASDVEVVGYL